MDDYSKLDDQLKADLLRKYLDGSATPDEIRQIEAAAVYDDFLFEAIEGGFTQSTTVNNEALSDLKRKLNISPTQSKPIYWSLIAAASLAMLFGVWSVFNTSDVKNNDLVVVNTVEETPKDIYEPEIVEEELEQIIPSAQEKKSTKPKVANKKKVQPKVIDDAGTLNDDVGEKTSEVEIEAHFAKDKPGQIVNENNEPVVDVVPVREQNIPSDEDEVIVLEDKIIEETIESELEAPISFPKSTNKGRDGAMDYDNADAIIVDSLASPAMGYLAYDEYIRNAKRNMAFSHPIRGDVIVQFTVSPSGALSQFRIVKSLAKVFDDEAIRLIKDGPEWENNLETIEIVTSYTVSFY